MSLREYLNALTAELHSRLDHQRSVVMELLHDASPPNKPLDYCPLIDCPRRQRMRNLLQEAIRTLEETKSSFKSKRLEVMRKRFIAFLAEC